MCRFVDDKDLNEEQLKEVKNIRKALAKGKFIVKFYQRNNENEKYENSNGKSYYLVQGDNSGRGVDFGRCEVEVLGHIYSCNRNTGEWDGDKLIDYVEDDLKVATRKKEDMSSLKNAYVTYPTWKIVVDKGLGIQFNISEDGAEKPLTELEGFPKYSQIDVDQIPEKDKTPPYGVDIPILLKPANRSNGKLIFILGESARRNDEDINNFTNNHHDSDNVILGTPYAVHLENYPSQCKVYWMIFDKLLEKGYSLYITDIIKVWWKDKKLKPNKKDIEILKQELVFFEKEPIIVAWGNIAENELTQINKKPNDDFLPLPHPSTINWNDWKLRIFEHAVFREELSYATDLYGDDPNGKKNKTTAEKVATEAIRSIDEYISIHSKGS